MLHSAFYVIPSRFSREGFHIVIDFRTGTIVFLFGGPDSGQQ